MTDPTPSTGVFLAYYPWFTLEEQVELAVLADELGLDSLWVSEAYGFDVVTVLATLAACTRRIALGSAVMQIPARRATTTAMTAAALSSASGGRFRLGLGVSGPQVSEGWYGVPFGGGLTRTRDYVKQVRAALAGEAVQLPLDSGESTGLGKPIRMLVPETPPVPLYLAALAPKAIEQCFEIADGWIPFVVDKRMLEDHRAPTGRAFDVAATVPLAVASTVAEARDAVRPWLTFYFGAMGHPRKHFLVELAERYGHGASAREVQRRYLSREERATAGDALSDDLIDAAAIATTSDLVASRVAEYAAAGATSLIAVPCGDRPGAIRALAAL
jgi:F420-dependent oxidoreductase-like protein